MSDIDKMFTEPWNAAQERIAALEAELTDLNALFELQHQRMNEATELWRQTTGRRDISPDLGKLLAWLMERLRQAERERDALAVEFPVFVDKRDVYNLTDLEHALEAHRIAKERYLGFERELAEERARLEPVLDAAQHILDHSRDADCGDHCRNSCMWCALRAAIDAARKAKP